MIALWRGELPLAEAFWIHAVLWAGLANLVATCASLLLLAWGAGPALAVAVHLAPAPYVLVATIGVWRSAGRSTASFPTLARWGGIVWGLALLAL